MLGHVRTRDQEDRPGRAMPGLWVFCGSFACIHEPLHLVREVHRGALLGHYEASPGPVRVQEEEYVACPRVCTHRSAVAAPVPPAADRVCGSEAGTASRRSRPRAGMIEGFRVEIQHVLHLPDEVRAHSGHAPVLLLPRLHFFKVRRVSYESSSTAQLHHAIRQHPQRRSLPWGGSLQASAIRCLLGG